MGLNGIYGITSMAQFSFSGSRFGVKSYYCTELGFYIASIGMLIFWEVRRRDFAAMMIHHLATVSLIVGSYYLK